MCLPAGRDFLGLVRRGEHLAELRATGVPAEHLDLDEAGPALPGAWTQDRALIYMVPPPAAGTTDPRIRRFLDRLAVAPAALVYLSTTAVYGDAGGAVVDEETPPAPAADRGRRRLDAEQSVEAYGRLAGLPIRILRVPGIYGPGRLPVERIRAGARMPLEAQAGPGNRIHVDDLAAVCLAAADYTGPEQVFNVGDGDHASMTGYFQAVARAAGLPEPEQVPMEILLPEVSAAMRGFLTEQRKVSTARMRQVLGFTPRYADFREGIRASLAPE
ncbi:MAG: NAD-dependent epimerase/dehydratase family protein [Gammaproteobacteria bacterium]